MHAHVPTFIFITQPDMYTYIQDIRVLYTNEHEHAHTNTPICTHIHTNKYINACMHVCKYSMFDKYTDICTQKYTYIIELLLFCLNLSKIYIFVLVIPYSKAMSRELTTLVIIIYSQK